MAPNWKKIVVNNVQPEKNAALTAFDRENIGANSLQL